MYLLEQKQFIPEMILFGIAFIPGIIGLVFANIFYKKTELLIMLIFILFIYFINITFTTFPYTIYQF